MQGNDGEGLEETKSSYSNVEPNHLHCCWLRVKRVLPGRYLVSHGCIKPLCDLLNCQDARIVTVALEGLENILKVGEADKELGGPGATNMYSQHIDEAEGLDKIELLQNHNKDEIHEKAVKILERYFGFEDEEDQNLAPSVDPNANQYAFSGSTYQAPDGGFNFMSS